MAVQYDLAGKGLIHFVKGAPEVILTKCTSYETESRTVRSKSGPSASAPYEGKAMSAESRKKYLAVAANLANQGLRVLAFASGVDLQALTFLGFAAMYDAPRPGVAEVISQLTSGGVRVVMITGDSEATAVTIAKQIGVLSNAAFLSLNSSPSNVTMLQNMGHSNILSGSELDTMPERQMKEIIPKISIFYRATPRHKLTIVKYLQANGDIVAMTGDGVNDAPALKLADIGIASTMMPC
jgi:Ca2+-transporting ATPase